MKEKIKLFLFLFIIIFIGMSLTNILGCVIYGFSEGIILPKIAELPYLLFLIFSLAISAILTFLLIRHKR